MSTLVPKEKNKDYKLWILDRILNWLYISSKVVIAHFFDNTYIKFFEILYAKLEYFISKSYY